MIGLSCLEVCNSKFDITEEINKFELYTYLVDDEFPYTQLKDNVADTLGLTDISSEDLQQEIHWPNINETYRKLAIEKSQSEG